MCCKRYVLVRSQILRLFVNTLTAEYQYSSRNIQKFPKQIQTQLSQKRKAFPGFFIPFLKSTSRLEHFQEKDGPSNLIIPEIIDSKKSAYSNV